MEPNVSSPDVSSEPTSMEANPPAPCIPRDSTAPNPEEIGRRRPNSPLKSEDSSKKRKNKAEAALEAEEPPRKKGVAAVKPEYLLPSAPREPAQQDSRDSRDRRDQPSQKKKQKGQNTNRRFKNPTDAISLCTSTAHFSEFSPAECRFGEACKFEHNLRKYLKEGKKADLSTFNGKCPVWEVVGRCPVGWKCRFVGSHSTEIIGEDGKNELVLLVDEEKQRSSSIQGQDGDGLGVVNGISVQDKIELSKDQKATPRSDEYLKWLGVDPDRKKGNWKQKDSLMTYTEPPMLPSEKKRLYYGPETPVLSPLTTQGNLPFRRLCSDLGAQATWSEMAMAYPLLKGNNGEWALLKAHQSEMQSPKFERKVSVIREYDNAKDIKFGAQIAGNKPALVAKATEVLTALCPHLRAVDLNCGCPIDLVYNQGSGSALLDNPGRLEKMLRGMNTVSGDVPVTVKIRMGTANNNPTASNLVRRLAYGGQEATNLNLGPAGVAAVTLHGRSRQHRYTKRADWSYIAECAALIKEYNEGVDDRKDTAREPDERDQAPSNNGTGARESSGHMYFVGNGDCYSHTDYYDHIESAGVDSVMVSRGALMKPWIFEEIESGQCLDKTASERLQYIERFARYGLEYWGSDEVGLNTTRRFLLEWLSFSCRYIPAGILEHLPPHIQDRPPPYRGRNDLETLLRSDNYKDWIRISEMFLGKAHPDFRFEPKHKSNSYEMDAEG